jgi:branched-chain amino acid transport system permease protein
MKNKLNSILPPVVLVLIYFLIQLLLSKKILNPYHIQILMFACVNIMLTVSLNIVNGFTGQFCIGHAGFMSLGAYGSAIITTMLFGGMKMDPNLRIPVFLLSLLVGGILAAIVGFLIGLPTLKIKGDYLAIVTLAFGEIVRSTLRLIEPIGAARGMIGIPKITNLAWMFFFVMITLYITRNFVYSRYGRASIAIRDNEIAADAMGINTTRYKVIAFVFAAFIAGVAGGLYAHLMTFIQPDSFSFVKSNELLVYLYAGGSGSITGSVLGALVLTIIPEALRFLGNLTNWRIVIYAVILVLIMLYKPSGLFGGKEISFLRINRDSFRKPFNKFNDPKLADKQNS